MTVLVRYRGRQVEVAWCRECEAHGNHVVAVKGTGLCPWHSLSPEERERRRAEKKSRRKRGRR